MSGLVLGAIILGYFTCCFGGYRLLWRDWTRKFDTVTVGDDRFMFSLSLFGPITLAAGLILLLMSLNENDEVIWRKDKRP